MEIAPQKVGLLRHFSAGMRAVLRRRARWADFSTSSASDTSRNDVHRLDVGIWQAAWSWSIFGAGKNAAPKSSSLRIKRDSARVLLVDDDDEVREVVCEMLSLLGYTAVDFSTAREAVEWYRSEHSSIGVVMLDVIMPGMDGYECLVEMQKINPRVLAILSTGYGSGKQVKRMLAAGVYGLVEKPYKMEELGRVLAEVLAGRNALNVAEEK